MDSVVVGAPAAAHHRLNSAVLDLDNIACRLQQQQRRSQQQQQPPPPRHYATLPAIPRLSTLAQCPGVPQTAAAAPSDEKSGEKPPKRWLPKSGSASLSLTFASRPNHRQYQQQNRRHQNQQGHWWKVCWLYGNGGHLLEQQHHTNHHHHHHHSRSSQAQAQVQPTSVASVASVASLHRSPSDVPKQQQQSTSSSSSLSCAVATLPSHFRLHRRRRRDGAK